MVEHAVLGEVALVQTARHDRLAHHGQHGAHLRGGLGVAHADAPRRAVGTRAHGEDVAAQVHKSAVTAVGHELAGKGVGDVALGDAAQVKACNRVGQAHGAALRVALDHLPAHMLESIVERLAARHNGIVEVPQGRDGTHGDVEDATRCLAVGARLRDEVVGALGKLHPLAVRVVEARHFRIGAGAGKLHLKLDGQVTGGNKGLVELGIGEVLRAGKRLETHLRVVHGQDELARAVRGRARLHDAHKRIHVDVLQKIGDIRLLRHGSSSHHGFDTYGTSIARLAHPGTQKRVLPIKLPRIMKGMHAHPATCGDPTSVLDAFASRDAVLVRVAFTGEAREVVGRFSHKVRQTVSRDNRLAAIGACRPGQDFTQKALVEQARAQGVERLVEHEQAALTGRRPPGRHAHKLERTPQVVVVQDA